jgi:hypothetical protein
MAQRELQRGVEKYWTVKVPVTDYAVGDKIFFAMKQKLDTDPTDAKAEIKKTLTDSDITASDSTYKTYTLGLTDTDTLVPVGNYRAELKRMATSGAEVPYPKFDVTVKLIVNNRKS